MGWLFAFGLAAIALVAMILLGRLPRPTWELLGAALLLGIAGYAWQGKPALPGAPRTVQERTVPFDENLAEQRRGMAERFGKAGQWLVLSDGLGRQGKTQDAANVLTAAVNQQPNDPNLWIGLANALVAHGEGVISPSAEFAFRRAMTIDPEAPAAPYFYGMALARSGQLDAARKIWAPLAARLPKQSQLRAELDNNLAMIERALAGR